MAVIIYKNKDESMQVDPMLLDAHLKMGWRLNKDAPKKQRAPKTKPEAIETRDQE